MFARSMFRTLALVFAAALVPATALAGEGHGKDHDAAFPMKGAEFMSKVDAKIQKTRERVAEGVAKKNLPEATRKQVMAEVDAGSAKVRAAATKVAADGTVTKEEAKQVRELAHTVKKELRAKAGLPEKGHGKGKGKGGKGKRGGDKA
jgi:hypothetical protein